MSASQVGESSQTEAGQDPAEFYGVRDGILFVVDSSPEMFEKNEQGECFFANVIDEYIYILKQKLVWNRKDWMGLVLFGTEEWDKDPELKNILTIHKLSLVNINQLKEAEKIRDVTWEDYKRTSSSKSYPLCDVLWHAAQSFSNIKLTMSARRVLLYTCHDVPPLTDEHEKHRIRAKAATYNDIGIKLHVLGVKDDWNFEAFYKDLEMLSRNVTHKDYKRISYNNLIQQLKRPAKTMAKLPFRIGKDIVITVDIASICVKAIYLKKVKRSLDTNAPLVSHTYFRKAYEEEGEEEEESDGEGDSKIIMPVPRSDLRKVQKYGGKEIYFTVEEVESLNRIYEVGIDIVDVKPLSCDPMYHFQAAYSVTCNKNCGEGERLLFAGLLDRCEQRKLMLTCRVTMRKNLGTFLYNMLPLSSEGKFYLHRIPYEESVRDFTKPSYSYVYNDTDKKPPINPEGVRLFKKIFKRTRSVFDPEHYPNPKLQVMLHNLETLALDLESREPPEDRTLPLQEELEKRISGLTKQVKELFQDECAPLPKKRLKTSEKDDSKFGLDQSSDDVMELLRTNQIEKCKVAELKNFCQILGLAKSGVKADLVSRLYSYYKDSSKS